MNRRIPALALAFMATTFAAASDWLSEVRALDFGERLARIQAVSQQAPETRRARVKDLVALLRDADQSVRVTAAAELAEIKEVAAAAIPALIASFAQPHGEEGLAYEAAVVAFGSRSIPALEAALGHKEWLVGTRACAALAKLHPSKYTRAACAPVPKDVARYLERREACDHWRGEVAYDADRKAQIHWSTCQACTGSDAGLAALQKKYASDATVLAKLADLEPDIEPKSARERRDACKGVKKPKSLQGMR